MKKYLVVALLLTLGVVACKKEDDKVEPIVQNPNACPDGNLCFEARGEKFQWPVQLIAKTNNGSTSYEIKHDDATKKNSASLYLNSLDLQTYDFGVPYGSADEAEMYIRIGKADASGLRDYYISGDFGGTLNLTNNAGSYSATFNFKGYDQINNDTVLVTNGRFNNLKL